ncbi:hypothetical protein [Staphylococcus aureus]|nr:hypothetical protein [Staphylococcus aureus]
MKTGEQISFHDIKHNNVWYIVKIVSKYWCDSDYFIEQYVIN